MNYCIKCGEALNGNAKFCTKCGTKVDLVHENYTLDDESIITYKKIEDTNSWTKNELKDFKESKKTNKSKVKIILFAVISVVVIFAISAFTFIKINSNQKEQTQSIAVVNADITNYPNISLTIKAENYSEGLKSGNFTIKEKDAFQKDLKLEKADENKYILSYKTSDESTSGERNVKVAYLENNKEAIAEVKYSVPEKNKNNDQTTNSNNTVNTYDKNEVDIKSAIDKYESAFIRMVNSKDTSYIKDTLDLDGNLLNEFNTMIKSYSEQKISENLIKHDIEKISKISDTQYEVTVYEKFNIYYGNKKESKNVNFRDTYILNKTNSRFKVYSIKKTETI